MDGEDDDAIAEVTIGIAGCDIADEAAPGRCVYSETLLQCIEDEEEKLLPDKTFCKSPLMTQSSIAELEAETSQKNHIVTVLFGFYAAFYLFSDHKILISLFSYQNQIVRPVVSQLTQSLPLKKNKNNRVVLQPIQLKVICLLPSNDNRQN